MCIRDSYKIRGLIVLTFFSSLCWADGIFVHFSGSSYQLLPLLRTDVNISIQDQISNVIIEHTFNNPAEDTISVTYYMRLPLEASVVGFGVYKNGKLNEWGLVPGQGQGGDTTGVTRRVPGLENHLGKNRFVITIPKVPPGENTLQLKYTELLPYDLGLVKFSYPLYSGDFLVQPLQAVRIVIDLKSQRRISDISSPTHTVEINKSNDYSAMITYIDEAVTPNRDFELDYRLSQEDIGLWALTYREEEDLGFYLLTVEPGQEITPGDIVAKNFTFILDRSGSMEGKKIIQAKEAASYCISHLNPNDYFNVVRYNHIIETFSPEPILADSSNIQAALNWISGTIATGNTDINKALLTGLNQYMGTNTANQILFLTDGLPTYGVTDPEQILNNVREANTHDVSIFVFGVGGDVNHRLLDGIALQNHGLVRYVAEDEPIDDAITDLFIRISNPILIKTKLDYGTIMTEDFYPPDTMLPDIFYGTQLRIFGRYSNSGVTDITLSGQVAEAETSIVYPNIQFPIFDTTYKFLPRSWAKSKIDYWLWWMSVYGERDSIIDMIVDLSLRYGILTPYTSYKDTSTGIFEKENIISFIGQFINDSVVLTWEISSHLKGATFNIYRSDTREGKYIKLNTKPLYTSRFIDSNVDQGETYYYRLDVVFNNRVVVSAVISVFTGEQGSPLCLQRIQPNPVREECLIRFSLGKDSDVRLAVFDITGRLIKELVHKRLSPDDYQVSWNTDGLPCGVYFIHLRAGNESQIERIVIGY